MCRTGGPRCYNEAKRSVRAAESAFVDAKLAHDAAMAAPAQAYDFLQSSTDAALFNAGQTLDQAYGDLAATERGEAELRDLDQGLGLLSGTLDQHLVNGQHQRRRGRIARAVRERPEHDSLEGVLGRTGDARADAMIDAAARNVAAKPFDYKTPVPHRLPRAILTGGNPDTPLVQRWTDHIHRKTAVVRSEQARLAVAERDVSMGRSRVRANAGDPFAVRHLAEAEESLMWAQNRLRDAEMELVVAADALNRVQNPRSGRLVLT